MEKQQQPSDGILEFKGTPNHSFDFKIEAAVRFCSLPIKGWNDNLREFDSKCRQSCVKDCSCVTHCMWLLA